MSTGKKIADLATGSYDHLEQVYTDLEGAIADHIMQSIDKVMINLESIERLGWDLQKKEEETEAEKP